MLSSCFIHINAPSGFSATVRAAAESASVRAASCPIQTSVLLKRHQLKLLCTTAYCTIPQEIGVSILFRVLSGLNVPETVGHCEQNVLRALQDNRSRMSQDL